jgi:hypothetical protein
MNPDPIPAEDPALHPQLRSPADQSKDRQFVIGSLLALLAITVFFLAVGRIDFTPGTAGQSTVASNPGPSAGSSSLPKGPGGK